MCRVRVLEAIKGPKKSSIWWYYGPISKLIWDPGRLQWPEAKEFMKYTSNQGRDLLRRQTITPNVVERKWAGISPTNYKLRWNNLWDTERVRKEAGLMWSIWHKAVAVNVWRGAISKEIDQSCPVCLKGIRETVMHTFWECEVAQKAWLWGEAVINDMAPAGERRMDQSTVSGGCADRNVTRPTAIADNRIHRRTGNTIAIQGRRPQKLSINWKQSIFGHRLPARFKVISRIWLLIWGVVLWHIWEQRNEVAFDGRYWHLAKLYHKLWLSMIDYGRICWSRTLGKVGKIMNNPEKSKKLIEKFQNSWCRKNLLTAWVSDRPQWSLVDPRYTPLPLH